MAFGAETVAVSEPDVVLDPALPAQGYSITIAADGVTIHASDDAGGFYARMTLLQLARVHELALDKQEQPTKASAIGTCAPNAIW